MKYINLIIVGTLFCILSWVTITGAMGVYTALNSDDGTVLLMTSILAIGVGISGIVMVVLEMNAARNSSTTFWIK